MKPTKILTKGIGLGTLYFVLSDAHLYGIAGKNKNPRVQIAKTYPDMYIKSQMINSDTLLTRSGKLKKRYFDFCMGDSFMPAVHGVTGYISGFTTALCNDILPLSLSIGAIALKRGGGICAGLLGLMGAKAVIYDICGFGQPKKI